MENGEAYSPRIPRLRKQSDKMKWIKMPIPVLAEEMDSGTPTLGQIPFLDERGSMLHAQIHMTMHQEVLIQADLSSSD